MRRVWPILLFMLFLSGCQNPPITSSAGLMTVFPGYSCSMLPQTVSENDVEAMLLEISRSDHIETDIHPARNVTHLLEFSQGNEQKVAVYFDQISQTATIERVIRGKTTYDAYQNVNIDLSDYSEAAITPLVYDPPPRQNDLALRALVTPQQLAQIGEKVPYELVRTVGYTYRLETDVEAVAIPSFADETESALSINDSGINTSDSSKPESATVWLITAPGSIDMAERVDSLLRITIHEGEISTIQIHENELNDVTRVAFVSQDDVHIIKVK